MNTWIIAPLPVRPGYQHDESVLGKDLRYERPVPSTHLMHWYSVPSSATSSVAPLFSLQQRLCTVSMALDVDFSSSLLMFTRLFWGCGSGGEELSDVRCTFHFGVRF